MTKTEVEWYTFLFKMLKERKDDTRPKFAHCYTSTFYGLDYLAMFHWMKGHYKFYRDAKFVWDCVDDPTLGIRVFCLKIHTYYQQKDVYFLKGFKKPPFDGYLGVKTEYHYKIGKY